MGANAQIESVRPGRNEFTRSGSDLPIGAKGPPDEGGKLVALWLQQRHGTQVTTDVTEWTIGGVSSTPRAERDGVGKKLRDRDKGAGLLVSRQCPGNDQPVCRNPFNFTERAVNNLHPSGG